METPPSRLFWRPVVRGWFGGGSGVVRGWFGAWFGGSGVWFGDGSGVGSGVVRGWFRNRFSRKCENFSHFDDFGEFPSVYARSGTLQFFFHRSYKIPTCSAV